MMSFMHAVAQPVVIPPELTALADQALSVACKDKATSQFDSIMTELGKKVDLATFKNLLPLEAQSLQAKVIVIAYYRARHDELYDKIMNAFFIVTSKSLGWKSLGGPRSPDVTPEYLAEKYRLIWEYQALSLSRDVDMRNQRLWVLSFAGWRPIEALGRIGNEKSLNVLELAYQKTLTDNNTYDFPDPPLGKMLTSIVKIGSSETNNTRNAFKSFFRCFTVSEKYDDAFTMNTLNKSTEKYFILHFSGMYPEILSRWKDAARAYPKDNLTPRELAFIQSVIDYR